MISPNTKLAALRRIRLAVDRAYKLVDGLAEIGGDNECADLAHAIDHLDEVRLDLDWLQEAMDKS